ncbi:hypothetical protein JXA05_00840 [Candidatus Peregrinibacteria bacterium]|nr:hypothetical protein [Candidatus Peregrinibacteria bacterium]
MTKEELLRIIAQNADILTPENYQRVIKNAAILTDEDKRKIANYLSMARELLEANNDFMKKAGTLNREAGDHFKSMREGMVREEKKILETAEGNEKRKEKEDAEKVISNF